MDYQESLRKDAYLIIAHKNIEQLCLLVSLLDFKLHDIYIHIDKKWDNCDYNRVILSAKESRVFLYSRFDVKWGTDTQVQTEMFLLRKASQLGGGVYRYYHLLSGQDLPIKPNEYIYHFFDDKKCEFLQFGADDHLKYRFRISQFHCVGLDKKPMTKLFLDYLNRIMAVLHVDRLTGKSIIVYKGSNWASLSSSAVEYLLKNQSKIRKMTMYSLCADEIYKQTILMNAGHFTMWQAPDIRLIDWERREGNSPHTFTFSDLELLMSSECLFARKFDYDVDRQICEAVSERIK